MKALLRQFAGQDHGPFVQFVKYGIAGCMATAVHVALFHLAAWKLFPALQASDPFVVLLDIRVPELTDVVRARNSMIDNAIAFIFSNLTAYIINILWVFKRGRHHILVEIVLFYLVSGVSIVIGTTIMGLLIRYLGWQTTIAFGANLVAALLINFAMRKFVIFKG